MPRCGSCPEVVGTIDLAVHAKRQRRAIPLARRHCFWFYPWWKETKVESDVPSSACPSTSSVARSPIGHLNDPLFPWCPARPDFDIIFSSAVSFLLLQVKVVLEVAVAIVVPIARQIASTALSPPGLDGMGRVRLGSDMRIMSCPVQNRGVEIGKIVQQVDKVVLVVPQIVSSGARDPDLVFSAEFESVGFVSNLCKEPKPVFWRGRTTVFNHLRELVDFGGNERHGGREDRIELAEVGEVPGEVEGERVEGMCVFCEESERVDGRWISHAQEIRAQFYFDIG